MPAALLWLLAWRFVTSRTAIVRDSHNSPDFAYGKSGRWPAQTQSKRSESKDECKVFNGSIRYVFSAPKALTERKWKSLLMTPSFNNSVKAVVCDEAHCVEFWGSSIEPYHQSYSNLASLQAFLTSSIPYVATTATASISTKVKTCVKWWTW